MGTLYFVACRYCHINRDLDKWSSLRIVETRDGAIDYAYAVECERIALRFVLLASFMREHIGHDCVLFRDQGGEDCALQDELNPYDVEQDIHPWSEEVKRGRFFWGKNDQS